VGYGEGVYRLEEAPMPVYSTHPNCRCTLKAVYRVPTFKYTPVKKYNGVAPKMVPVKKFIA
jgi:hypothetical protein